MKHTTFAQHFGNCRKTKRDVVWIPAARRIAYVNQLLAWRCQ